MVNLAGINRYFYLKGYGCTAIFFFKLRDVSWMEGALLSYIDLLE